MIDYFEKYFLDKNIDRAVLDALKNGTTKLSGVYLEFCMIFDCLGMIFDDDNLSDNSKKLINEILEFIVCIKTDIGNIIDYIVSEICD